MNQYIKLPKNWSNNFQEPMKVYVTELEDILVNLIKMIKKY